MRAAAADAPRRRAAVHPALTVTPDSPMQSSAALLVSVLLASHPWATAPDADGQPPQRRPRLTPEERDVLHCAQGIMDRAAWRRQEAAEIEAWRESRREGQRFEVACQTVGVQFHRLLIPREARPDAPTLHATAGYAERRMVDEAHKAHAEELCWAVGSNQRKEKVFFS